MSYFDDDGEVSGYLDETGVVNDCKPLIDEAREKNMLLWEQTNHFFVAPDALIRLQRGGQFRWSAENWRLIARDSIEATQWGSGYLQ